MTVDSKEARREVLWARRLHLAPTELFLTFESQFMDCTTSVRDKAHGGQTFLNDAIAMDVGCEVGSPSKPHGQGMEKG